jgi:hypothetical protein
VQCRPLLVRPEQAALLPGSGEVVADFVQAGWLRLETGRGVERGIINNLLGFVQRIGVIRSFQQDLHAAFARAVGEPINVATEVDSAYLFVAMTMLSSVVFDRLAGSGTRAATSGSVPALLTVAIVNFSGGYGSLMRSWPS